MECGRLLLLRARFRHRRTLRLLRTCRRRLLPLRGRRRTLPSTGFCAYHLLCLLPRPRLLLPSRRRRRRLSARRHLPLPAPSLRRWSLPARRRRPPLPARRRPRSRNRSPFSPSCRPSPPSPACRSRAAWAAAALSSTGTTEPFLARSLPNRSPPPLSLLTLTPRPRARRVGAFAFLNVSGLTSDVLSVVLQQGDITANGACRSRSACVRVSERVSDQHVSGAGEVVLVACGIIPAPACVPGNGSSAYALVPPLNATYSVADVFANVIDSTADPGYDSFYLGVYTAGQAHEPSLRPYLRGQARAGAAGRVAECVRSLRSDRSTASRPAWQATCRAAAAAEAPVRLRGGC